MKKTTLDIEIHEKKPEGFTPQVQVAACYLEIDNKLLLLQRAVGKSQPGKWSVPAGKLERDEIPEDAAKRELFEETGISLERPSQIQRVSSLYVHEPEKDYIYHMFRVQLDQTPHVQLSNEHESYKWVTSKELEEMPLMMGAMEAIRCYRASLIKKRSGASVNAYLILKQGNKVLLQLRKNTGYCDGMWSLVAGHVEEGESATAAMIREAREEIGIELSPSQIQVVHIMHRKTNRFNVDILFDCTSWQGRVQNLEIEKCEKLEFFPLSALPSNIVDYNAAALRAILNGQLYSEQGWNK